MMSTPETHVVVEDTNVHSTRSIPGIKEEEVTLSDRTKSSKEQLAPLMRFINERNSRSSTLEVDYTRIYLL